MSSDPNVKVKALFACIDWRLHPQLENYFINNGLGCDLCVTAGSVKSLIDPATQGFLLEQIAISKKLHNCQAVVLTMHMDCGAYGGSKAFGGNDAEVANCTRQLNLAKAIVERNFPGLPVESFIINLEKGEAGWNIKPVKIQI